MLNTYLSTIQNAFREVNDSLISIQKLRELLKIQNRHISVLKDNVSFARSRYESQLLSNYNEVLEAEKNLLSKEVEYILAQMGLFEATVNIFKAMGGGWVTEAAMQMALSSQKAEPTSNAQ